MKYFRTSSAGATFVMSDGTRYVARGGIIETDVPEHVYELRKFPAYGREFWDVNKNGVSINPKDGTINDERLDSIVEVPMPDGQLELIKIRDVAKAIVCYRGRNVKAAKPIGNG